MTAFLVDTLLMTSFSFGTANMWWYWCHSLQQGIRFRAIAQGGINSMPTIERKVASWLCPVGWVDFGTGTRVRAVKIDFDEKKFLILF
jgi:hypothetical protein